MLTLFRLTYLTMMLYHFHTGCLVPFSPVLRIEPMMMILYLRRALHAKKTIIVWLYTDIVYTRMYVFRCNKVATLSSIIKQSYRLSLMTTGLCKKEVIRYTAIGEVHRWENMEQLVSNEAHPSFRLFQMMRQPFLRLPIPIILFVLTLPKICKYKDAKNKIIFFPSSIMHID